MYKQAIVGDGSREYLWQDSPEGIAVGLAQDAYRECVKALIPVLKSCGFSNISEDAFKWMTDGIKDGLTEAVYSDIQKLENGDVFECVRGERHDEFMNNVMADLRRVRPANANQLRVPTNPATFAQIMEAL